MNPDRDDVVDEIMKLTDGYGCDIYIEATGHPSSVVQGMQMIQKLGTFVEFSVFVEPTTRLVNHRRQEGVKCARFTSLPLYLSVCS